MVENILGPYVVECCDLARADECGKLIHTVYAHRFICTAFQSDQEAMSLSLLADHALSLSLAFKQPPGSLTFIR